MELGLSTAMADATDILLIDFRASSRMYRARPIEVALGWQDEPGHWQFASRIIRPGADWRQSEWSQDHAEDAHTLSLEDLQHGFSACRVLVWLDAMSHCRCPLSPDPAGAFFHIGALARDADDSLGVFHPDSLYDAIEERTDEDAAFEATKAFFDAEHEAAPCSARRSVELMARHWDLALGAIEKEAA
jgi:hypothetical protein